MRKCLPLEVTKMIASKALKAGSRYRDGKNGRTWKVLDYNRPTDQSFIKRNKIKNKANIFLLNLYDILKFRLYDYQYYSSSPPDPPQD